MLADISVYVSLNEIPSAIVFRKCVTRYSGSDYDRHLFQRKTVCDHAKHQV